MFSKKGEGLSINVIIVAAIGLLVLVILSVLLIRSGGELVTDCADVSGSCVGDCQELGAGIYSLHPSAKCTNEGDVCCIAIQKQE